MFVCMCVSVCVCGKEGGAVEDKLVCVCVCVCVYVCVYVCENERVSMCVFVSMCILLLLLFPIMLLILSVWYFAQILQSS